ncbi:MAG TPA: hypothetical protein PKW56_03325 [Clostridiales bacterium]|mgnify:CR=1 FL=1|nr:hypothetical protein [Clostridiales bacterium]
MKYTVLAAILTVILAGCSAFRPVVGDPVARDESIKKTEAVEVDPAKMNDKIIVSSEKKSTHADKISFSISDLEVVEKNNGVLISLNYKGDDPVSNISSFFSGDSFFNISFYKGKFSDSIKNYVYNKSVVRSVKFFEFGDSVQITLRLKKDYNSSDISTVKGKIIISVFN